MDGQARFRLQPLADYVLEKIKRANGSRRRDEFPTLAPGTGKTQKAWLWRMLDDWPFGGNGPPMEAYCFETAGGGRPGRLSPRCCRPPE